jgi:TolA-binding protein
LAWGEALQGEGRTDEACQIWRKALAEDDSTTAPTLLLRLADVELDRGAPDEAIKYAETFLSKYPQDALRPQMQRRQAQALLKQGNHAAAADILTAIDEPNAEARASDQCRLAMAQLGAGQFEQSLQTLAAIDRAKLDPETSAALLIAEGSAHIASKDPASALKPLREYLEKHPAGVDLARCQAQLCVAQAQLADFSQALSVWRSLTQTDQADETTLATTLFLADAAAAARQFEIAREAYAFLANQDQPEVKQDALARLASLEEASNNPEASVEKIDQLLALGVDDDQAEKLALARAKGLERAKKTEPAQACYLDFIQKHPKSAALPEALLAAARLHDVLEQDREADGLLARLAKDHAHYEHFDAALYQWAGVLEDLRRPDDAAKKYAELHNSHPQSRFWADATYRLAQHQVQEKSYAQAEQILSDLVAARPESTLLGHALLLQGQTAILQEQWAAVSVPLERFLQEFPRHDSRLLADYWLAEAEYRTANYAQAQERLSQLSTQLEGRKEEWLPMIQLRLGQVLAQQNKWQEASQIAHTFAQNYPDFPQIYEVDYLLGRCLAAQARFNDARAAYDRVLRSPRGGKSETAAMAQWMIGESYFQQQEFEEAIAAYHRVERLFAYPQWQAAALLQAGKCREAQGQWQEALRCYEQLLKQHAETMVADEAEQRVRVVRQRAQRDPPPRLPGTSANSAQ